MPETKAVSTLDNVVVKSPNDRRLYRVIELENGLSALLIHDPDIYPEGFPADGQIQMDEDDEEDGEEEEEEEEDSDGSYEDDEDDEEDEEGDEDEVEGKGDHQTKKAAAAMCVAMGSFLDPPEAQGLAHFLEHMLFMGSTEFPDENEYDSYLSKHGGSSNAYTEMEHTCYHFEVKREFLQGALKRFSQFFVAPLMKTEAMEREVLAVDSEFNQALQNDACRLQQLQCYTSGKGHPFNRFSWGNKKSLSGAMENGVDLRECIVKLYKEYYRGGLMKLVVIGGESLDVLESWVVELFGDVKNGSKIRPTLEAKGPIWEGGKLYRLEAVKDVHTLDLTWTLPPLRHAYVKKPEDYLAHLLGHEGKGSLLSFLKGRGWATSLSAGVGDDGINRSSLAYVFGMSINLTDSGLEKIYDIIGYVYQYLKLLRNASPQEWIFKELQDIGNMDFRYAEEQAADDYAAELSENMLAYPVEHIIYGDYVYQTWDPKMIEDLMGFFIPKNMRIDVVSKSIKSEEFQTEPWFGSHYIEEVVPLSLMETWSNPSEVDRSLHLPSENQFIPSDFSIRAINSDGDPKSQSPPKCIIDEPLMKFWYKLDETFKVPRANTYFRINLKGAYGSVKNCLLTELFINLLKDELNEIIYQASIAKLETSLSMYGDKLELKVYGFNEKIPALLVKILAIAKSFMPSLDRFKVIKENMERGLRNTNMKPLNHSTYLRLQLLCKRIYDSDEKLSVLNDLSLTDLNSFIPEVRSQIFIEALCHGNLSEDEAVNISNIFKNSLTVEPLPVKSRHGEQITCFPLSAKLVRDVNVKNKSETNSVVELYYQIEPEEAKSTRMKAVVDLFSEIIEEPLFNQLRTKEQLGYVVECGPRLTYRVHGFCFCVQSSKYGPVHLLGRIDNFIKDIEGMLEQLDEESFEDYRSGLIGKLLEKDPSLLSETNELWSQIVDKRYVFDYSQKEAEELRSIEKKDVISWYRTYFKESSPKSRRLAVRVWGCNTNMKETQTDTKSVQVIVDAVAFKSTSKFYPSLC
ncbi:Insulinase (Peptidase family M16) family protein [Raphanus sativus]|uniref:Nardilysin-like isoform X1 n=1 Tax=Raphanus sativus TaxID=3726 RepID=A0A6J0LRF7_RAPSA|nr:nardilysin-like isoform X1 [Raphanus sativus]KAJ4878926.1 Insulinase (Peptidase family M16) family protein [Raphanus sativus]